MSNFETSSLIPNDSSIIHSSDQDPDPSPIKSSATDEDLIQTSEPSHISPPEEVIPVARTSSSIEHVATPLPTPLPLPSSLPLPPPGPPALSEGDADPSTSSARPSPRPEPTSQSDRTSGPMTLPDPIRTTEPETAVEPRTASRDPQVNPSSPVNPPMEEQSRPNPGSSVLDLPGPSTSHMDPTATADGPSHEPTSMGGTDPELSNPLTELFTTTGPSQIIEDPNVSTPPTTIVSFTPTPDGFPSTPVISLPTLSEPSMALITDGDGQVRTSMIVATPTMSVPPLPTGIPQVMVNGQAPDIAENAMHVDLRLLLPYASFATNQVLSAQLFSRFPQELAASVGVLSPRMVVQSIQEDAEGKGRTILVSLLILPDGTGSTQGSGSPEAIAHVMVAQVADPTSQLYRNPSFSFTRLLDPSFSRVQGSGSYAVADDNHDSSGSEKGKQGLSKGAIIALTVSLGATLYVALMVGSILLYRRYKARKRTVSPHD